MNRLISITPALLLLLVVVVAVMITTIFQFDKLRWSPAKDFLSRFCEVASDWTACKDELRHPLVVSAISTLILTYALFDVAW